VTTGQVVKMPGSDPVKIEDFLPKDGNYLRAEVERGKHIVHVAIERVPGALQWSLRISHDYVDGVEFEDGELDADGFPRDWSEAAKRAIGRQSFEQDKVSGIAELLDAVHFPWRTLILARARNEWTRIEWSEWQVEFVVNRRKPKRVR
jgi:hypothetical protein